MPSPINPAAKSRVGQAFPSPLGGRRGLYSRRMRGGPQALFGRTPHPPTALQRPPASPAQRQWGRGRGRLILRSTGAAQTPSGLGAFFKAGGTSVLWLITLAHLHQYFLTRHWLYACCTGYRVQRFQGHCRDAATSRGSLWCFLCIENHFSLVFFGFVCKIHRP